MAYEASLKAKWDWQNALAWAKKEGQEEARKEERARAEAEKRNIARELKKLGVSVVKISKSTGLSPDEIEAL